MALQGLKPSSHITNSRPAGSLLSRQLPIPFFNVIGFHPWRHYSPISTGVFPKTSSLLGSRLRTIGEWHLVLRYVLLAEVSYTTSCYCVMPSKVKTLTCTEILFSLLNFHKFFKKSFEKPSLQLFHYLELKLSSLKKKTKKDPTNYNFLSHAYKPKIHHEYKMTRGSFLKKEEGEKKP